MPHIRKENHHNVNAHVSTYGGRGGHMRIWEKAQTLYLNIQAAEEAKRKAAAEAEAKRKVLGDLQPPTPLPSRFVKYDSVCLAPPTRRLQDAPLSHTMLRWVIRSLPADLRFRERLYVRKHMHIHAYWFRSCAVYMYDVYSPQWPVMRMDLFMYLLSLTVAEYPDPFCHLGRIWYIYVLSWSWRELIDSSRGRGKAPA
jgi:hypothetical protein